MPPASPGMLAALALALAACQAGQVEQRLSGDTAARVPVGTTSSQLQPSPACSGSFVTHNLAFATGMRLREISTYISNGAGVAANDLDAHDGDSDFGLRQRRPRKLICGTTAAFACTTEADGPRSRACVAIVDVDGDGWNDITFTHRGLEGVDRRNLGDAAENNHPRQPALHACRCPALTPMPMPWPGRRGRRRRARLGDGLRRRRTRSSTASTCRSSIHLKAGVVLHLQRGAQWVPQAPDQSAETLLLASGPISPGWAAGNLGCQ